MRLSPDDVSEQLRGSVARRPALPRRSRTTRAASQARRFITGSDMLADLVAQESSLAPDQWLKQLNEAWHRFPHVRPGDIAKAQLLLNRVPQEVRDLRTALRQRLGR